MGILVCYDDFTYDVVSDHQLGDLLATGSIIGYDSCGEWVKSEGSPCDPCLPTAPKRQGRRSAKRRGASMPQE